MLTRRHALMTGASLPLVALTPMPVLAQTEAAAETPKFHRIMLGSFEVTVLLAGSSPSDPVGTFGLNVSPDEFMRVSTRNFVPADRAVSYYTPTLVKTGTDVILFDTGADPAAMVAVLQAAGYAPADITMVIITHMHGDHIGGLSTDGQPTFPNARLVTGRVEYDYWMGAENETFDAKVRPLSEGFTLLEGEQEAAPGITAIEAFGHSPGHMCYRLESEGQRLILSADTANHYVWSLGQPTWEVRFDMDKAAAIATRQRILGLIADERLPFIGYHMPFPAIGYIARDGENFRYMPATYQFDL